MTHAQTRVAVIGARGLLGSRIVARLVDSGYAVTAVSRQPDLLASASASVRVVKADMLDPVTIEEAVSDADCVITTANGFFDRVRDPARSADSRGNLNVIRACQDARVDRLIFVSGDVGGPPGYVDFFRWKGETEAALRNTSLAYTIVRPSKFMEVWTSMVSDSIRKNGKAMVFGSGRTAENYASVDDVAVFVAEAVADESLTRAVLNIRGPENITGYDLVARCSAALGTKARITRMPVPLLKALGAVLTPLNPAVGRLMKAASLSDMPARPADGAVRIGTRTLEDVLAAG